MPYTDENSYKEIGFISGQSVKEYAENMALSADGNYRVMDLPGVDKDNHDNFLVFVDGVLFNEKTELKFGIDEILIDVRYIGENSRVVVFNRRTDESFYSYQKEINKNVSGLDTSYGDKNNDFLLICITENNEIRLHDTFILNHHAILSDSHIKDLSSGYQSGSDIQIYRRNSYFELYYSDYNIRVKFNDDGSIEDYDGSKFTKLISEKDLGGKFFYIDDIYHAPAHGGNYINVMKLFDDTNTIKRLTFDGRVTA